VSDLFDEEPAEPTTRRPGRRARALVITGAALLLAFFGLTALSAIYTDRLWYKEVGYGQVFSTMLWTRVGLFLIFGVFMAAVVAVNMHLAYRFRPLFRMPGADTSVDRYRDAVTPVRTWLLVGVALVVGVFAGTSALGQWRTYLLWRHGRPFGEEDAHFGRDVGFYVFDLPWWHYVTDFVMAAAVVALIATAVVHYLYGGIRLQVQHDRLSGAAQVQFSVLLGIFVLAKGVDYYLDRFDLVTQDHDLFTGMNYTGENALLPARNILMGVAVICAILFFLNIWRRTWQLPSVGLALLALSAVLLGMIWPAIVQNFQVQPSEADKESPYIEANIEATRHAFGLEDVESEPLGGEGAATDEISLAQLNNQLKSQLTKVPVVDPQQVRQTFEQRQQPFVYYSVPPVLDVDRYTIDGAQQPVVLGLRELDQSGINAADRNWSNLHTVYTHGEGVIAAYGNKISDDETNGRMVWAEGIGDAAADDLSGGTEIENRIYFGENSPSYSIVGKRSEDAADIELDLPGGDGTGTDRTTTYDGEDGVSVGGFFNKLLYAVRFGEPNLMLSGRVHENSRILYHRDPALRVEKVAPWLTVDSDPFPAVVDGRVVWLLDGYTLTDQYPMSEKGSFDEMTDDSLANDARFQTLPSDHINYMRNAVKATVDAYDGKVTLYAWDEEDPLLRAWMGAFPGTVQPKSEIPEAVLEHLRYPEDMFKVQRYQLGAYHVLDAGDFYEANDRWEVPTDPNNPTSLQPPYRLSVPSSGASDMFSLTSVYTPVNRENLAAFVSVDADAVEDTYGTIRVKRLNSSSQIPGPGQIANQIQSDQAVTQALLPYNRETNTRVVNGNLLTLPVGGGLLYVQPLYSLRTSGEGNFPVLRFIAVSFGQEVGVGRTLGEAIHDVLNLPGIPSDSPAGGPPPRNGEPSDPGDEPSGSLQQRVQSLLNRADLKFEEADAALARGELGGYQDAVAEARALVQQAIDLVAAAARKPAETEAPAEGG
jgi:uncharacterized protein